MFTSNETNEYHDDVTMLELYVYKQSYKSIEVYRSF